MFSMLFPGFRLLFFVCILMPGVLAASGVSFQRDVRPILERKCVACHACYDAPCQLVMTHHEGLLRGASKSRVYNGTRIELADPSRLLIDAHNVEEWRQAGFHPVLPETGMNDNLPGGSLLGAMIAQYDERYVKSGKPLKDIFSTGISRESMCPSPDEYSSYLTATPHGGMPFGVSGLDQGELQTLQTWLREGAPIDVKPNPATSSQQRIIDRWETVLNDSDKRHQLIARWLYEHLFMAHLHLGDAEARFFTLVRSRTPPGKAVSIIATRSPNNDPGGKFYYRLQPVTGSIVYKTHIVFPFTPVTMERVKTLFFDEEWSVGKLPGYSEIERANPFAVFEAVPARARYIFMLEHAEYFVRTFIRGPVCHGQIATDVIRDQFWVFFQDPDSDFYITSPDYRRRVTGKMVIAGIEQDLLAGAKTWLSVRNQYDEYSMLRQKAYASDLRGGSRLSDIWNGNGQNTNASLTVFRHYDNASVMSGLVGDFPVTAWWMDYPLFERGYYNLVVNFDVFGSISHQAQTRFYFDLIRNDAERNFLRLMPEKVRQEMLDGWYEGLAKLKLLTSYQGVPDSIDTRIPYRTEKPLTEFFNLMLDKYASVNANQDVINRNTQPESGRVSVDKQRKRIFDYLARIAAVKRDRLPAVDYFPEATLLRVSDNENRYIFTILRNRIHTNVAFLFGEEMRLKHSEDTLTIVPGVHISYPNFMFDVPVADIGNFLDKLLAVESSDDFKRSIVDSWGVRRADPDFWDMFHDAADYQREVNVLEAGILDMSRYLNL